jgi:peptidoglycan/xylan/chitin deacetylase (PgdA/CDA1 family)
MAFTLDDLPVYPHMPLPDGHTPHSVTGRIIDAFSRNGVSGVFALANSWPLDVDPDYARILDEWVAAGHHIGNHTHTHPLLNETSADDFIHDISVADELLAPWISKAPLRAFRHPLELWGNTEEKRVRVNEHIDRLAYSSAGVTSWFYEWEWDRAWRYLLQNGDAEEAEHLKSEFVDYAAAQVAHDAEVCKKVFGHNVIGIGLIHPVVFFTEVADAFFARLFAEGVAFVSLSPKR